MTTILNMPTLALATISALYLGSNGFQGKKGSGGAIPHPTVPSRPVAAAAASQTITQCQSKYCPPTAVQILIDRPQNTLNRNDRGGGPTLRGAYEHTKAQYVREAANSPGVASVAQMVY